MTREHAKKILTHLRNGKSDLMVMDALDMAISALKGFEGMTNGEVIQALFPYVEAEDTPSNRAIATDLDGSYCLFMREWWNAPYKAESEVKPND